MAFPTERIEIAMETAFPIAATAGRTIRAGIEHQVPTRSGALQTPSARSACFGRPFF
jgi:hypothetical protein